MCSVDNHVLDFQISPFPPSKHLAALAGKTPGQVMAAHGHRAQSAATLLPLPTSGFMELLLTQYQHIGLG